MGIVKVLSGILCPVCLLISILCCFSGGWHVIYPESRVQGVVLLMFGVIGFQVTSYLNSRKS
jgi:hypothetical protein